MSPRTLTDFLAWTAPARRDVICGGVLPLGGILFAYGDEGTFKTWLVMQLACDVAIGRSWLIYETIPSKVLIINAEIPEIEFQRRWRDVLIHRTQAIGNIVVVTDMDMMIDTPIGASRLANWVREYQPNLVIVDNLMSTVTGDITKQIDTQRWIDSVNKIRSTYHTAFAIVHHARQAPYDPGQHRLVKLGTYEMFGSKNLTRWADTIMEVDHDRRAQMPDSLTLTPQKYRLCESIPPVLPLWFDRRRRSFDPLVNMPMFSNDGTHPGGRSLL